MDAVPQCPGLVMQARRLSARPASGAASDVAGVIKVRVPDLRRPGAACGPEDGVLFERKLVHSQALGQFPQGSLVSVVPKAFMSLFVGQPPDLRVLA